MENAKRNGTIDFFKFVGAVMIAGYHAGWLGLNGSGAHENSPFFRGYIAVEFYFIVSGYLLAAKAANYGGGSVFDANLKMIRKKFLGIFAYLYPAALAGHVVYTMVSYSPRRLSSNLLLSTSELLSLQMLGFPTFNAARSTWYLSALMFASFLIYPLLCKYGEACGKYVAPLCALFLYGLIMKNTGFLGTLYEWYGVVFTGMLRGIAGIFWGGGI